MFHENGAGMTLLPTAGKKALIMCMPKDIQVVIAQGPSVVWFHMYISFQLPYTFAWIMVDYNKLQTYYFMVVTEFCCAWNLFKCTIAIIMSDNVWTDLLIAVYNRDQAWIV